MGLSGATFVKHCEKRKEFHELLLSGGRKWIFTDMEAFQENGTQYQ